MSDSLHASNKRMKLSKMLGVTPDLDQHFEVNKEQLQFWFGNTDTRHMESVSSKATAASIRVLMSYVPKIVIRRFFLDQSPLELPETDRFCSAVLFADISGFTPLTESLANMGAEGVEKLTHHLNDYFGSIIDTILKWGGDIVKFAGDALLAIWPASKRSNLYISCVMACQCALSLQQELGTYVVQKNTLKLHIGVSAGDLSGIHVGGVQGRVEYFLAGDPIDQVSSCEAQAEPGETFISPQCYAAMRNDFVGEKIEKNYKLTGLKKTPLARRVAEFPKLMPYERQLRGYVPKAVLMHLQHGHKSQYIAELRTVTVIFVNLDDRCVDEEGTQRIQKAVSAIQKTLQQLEGTTRQFIQDDKGSVFLACFGLPPLSHQDDPARAVTAAVHFRSALEEIGIQPKIGVTTGRAFCGAVGSERRREYAMVGDIVNLSARLMVASGKFGGILADEATVSVAKQHGLEFQRLEPIKVKGKKHPINIYLPLAKKSASILNASNKRLSKRYARLPEYDEALVGDQHTDALRLIQYKLALLKQNQKGNVIMLEGEAGVGKTAIILEVVNNLKAKMFIGTCDNQHPLLGWSAIMSSVLHLDDPELEDEDAGSILKQQLANIPHKEGETPWISYAPLLKELFPLMDIEETEQSACLASQDRSEKFQRLLIKILKTLVPTGSVITLDDAHYMNSTEWALTLAICQSLKGILICVSLQPLAPAPFEYSQMDHCRNAHHVHIKNLSDTAARTLMGKFFGVDPSKVPNDVFSKIKELTRGNPFLIGEYVSAAIEQGDVTVKDGELEVQSEKEELALPGSLSHLITSKVDRLPLVQQTILKVASVIGKTFEVPLLKKLLPDCPEDEELCAQLIRLEEAHFLISEEVIEPVPVPVTTPRATSAADIDVRKVMSQSRPERYRSSPIKILGTGHRLRRTMSQDSDEAALFRNKSIFHFRNTTIQQAIYEIMLFSLRRELHLKVAKWLETEHALMLSSYYDILAYHYDMSDKNPAIAQKYYLKAGEKYLAEFAIKEAVKRFNQAIEVESKTHSDSKKKHKLVFHGKEKKEALNKIMDAIKLQRKLGAAYLRMGKYREADEHLRAALACMRVSLNSSSKQTKKIISTFPALLQREVILAFLLLSKLHFHTNRHVSSSASEQALEIAEKCNFWDEQSEACAQCSLHKALANDLKGANALLERGKTLAGDKLAVLSHLERAHGNALKFFGSWAEATQHYEKAKKICKETNNHMESEEIETEISILHFLKGNARASLHLSSIAVKSARMRGDVYTLVQALTSQALVHLQLCNISKASSKVDQIRVGLQSLGSGASVSHQLNYQALAALVHQRTYRPEEAWACCLRAEEIMSSSKPEPSFASFPCFTILPEVYIGFLLDQPSMDSLEVSEAKIAKKARVSIAELKKLCAAISIFTPRTQLLEGFLSFYQGHENKAQMIWSVGKQIAMKYGMKNELALIGGHMNICAKKPSHTILISSFPKTEKKRTNSGKKHRSRSGSKGSKNAKESPLSIEITSDVTPPDAVKERKKRLYNSTSSPLDGVWSHEASKKKKNKKFRRKSTRARRSPRHDALEDPNTRLSSPRSEGGFVKTRRRTNSTK